MQEAHKKEEDDRQPVGREVILANRGRAGYLKSFWAKMVR